MDIERCTNDTLAFGSNVTYWLGSRTYSINIPSDYSDSGGNTCICTQDSGCIALNGDIWTLDYIDLGQFYKKLIFGNEQLYSLVYNREYYVW